MNIDIENNPESKCILDYIQRRLKEKLNTTIFFSGEGGRGKSFSGIRLAELHYQKHFNEGFPIDYICDSLEQAVLLVRKFTRKGEAIVIEELSVLASRRDALTNVNKLWNKFIDMCRLKNAIIIANAPHKSFIDSHFSMMTHIWINCLKVDFKKDIVIARPLWLQTSPHKNEPYKHKFLNEEGFDIDYCYFRKPNPELLEEYNIRKEQSFDTLAEEIVMRMQKNRLEKFKELGQKRIPRREAQAYELYLKGESPKIAAEIMGITLGGYEKTLQRVKKRLKMVEYGGNAKEIRDRSQKQDKNSL